MAGEVWFSLDCAQRELAAQLAGGAEKYSGVEAGQAVHYGRPVEELVSAAAQAQLLVVGHRGRGEFEAMLFGSVV